MHGYHNTVRCAGANISMSCFVNMPVGMRSKEQSFTFCVQGYVHKVSFNVPNPEEVEYIGQMK